MAGWPRSPWQSRRGWNPSHRRRRHRLARRRGQNKKHPCKNQRSPPPTTIRLIFREATTAVAMTPTTCLLDGFGPVPLVRPDCAAEVSELIRQAAANKTAIYPLGGQTKVGL